MTKNELIDYFTKNVAQYENFPSEVMDYISLKTDSLNCELSESKKCRDMGDFEDIKEEVNGENSEIAKRMMYVISKIQMRSLCNCRYTSEEDIEFLISIGYSFEEILQRSFMLEDDYIEHEAGYRIISALCKYFHNDVENCADNLKNDIEKYKDIKMRLRRNRSLTYEDRSVLKFYVELLCAVILLDNDDEKYSRFKDVLAEYFKDAELNHALIIILYRSSSHDERLLDILKESIINDYYTSSVLEMSFYRGEQYLQFLRDNNLPEYPYYLLKVCGYALEYKANDLKLLFKNDRDTFMKTYEIAKDGVHNPENSMYLLGIMLNNNEGYDILQRDRDKFSDYVDDILAILGEKVNLYDLITGDNSKLKAKESLDINSILSETIGRYLIILDRFCLLYDYDENSKKFIEFLISNRKAINDISNLYNIINCFLESRNIWLGRGINSELNNIIENYLETEDLFKLACLRENDKIFNRDKVSIYANKYADKAMEFFNNKYIKDSTDKTLIWLDIVYYHASLHNSEIIMKFINHSSKKIRDFCEKYITENEDEFRNLLEDNMKSFKGETLKLVKRVIKEWDNEHKYGGDFRFKDNNEVLEFISENYDAANEKYTKWIDESYFENVRFKESEDIVPAKVIRFIYNEYMALSQVYRIRYCDKLIDMFNIEDFRNTISNLFDLWLSENSDAKKKNIGIPYCIYSSDSTILAMKKQLETWAKAARGAVAAYIVNAIALNGGKTALMMVESISNKFSNSRIKKAAKESFAYAAKVLQVPEDVLCDKIVPDLGFDKYGEKIIDYGTRTFKVTLMEDFTLSIYDNEKEKIIKSLPKPNDKDDKYKAESAKKEFSSLKKQLKAVVKNQTERLQQVLRNGRTWSRECFTELFVGNPIMQMFARKLIWGVYEISDNEDKEHKLLGTFRYMEDGTFNTEDEEEFEFPEKSSVGITLVHPCELSSEEKKAWADQLADYEIVQPFEQINLEVISLDEVFLNNNIVTKYENLTTKTGKLLKIFNKYNLLRGEILDGGGYACYHYVDKYLKIAVEINFEGMYVGMTDYDEDVELGEVIFYKIDEDFDDEPADEIKESCILDPRKLPQRFVSSVISIFDEIFE